MCMCMSACALCMCVNRPFVHQHRRCTVTFCLNPIFYDIRAQSHPDPVASDEALGKDETGHASLMGSFLPFGLHI